MRLTWQVMNNRTRMNFSFPCLMVSMKRWIRIHASPRLKVKILPYPIFLISVSFTFAGHLGHNLDETKCKLYFTPFVYCVEYIGWQVQFR